MESGEREGGRKGGREDGRKERIKGEKRQEGKKKETNLRGPEKGKSYDRKGRSLL